MNRSLCLSPALFFLSLGPGAGTILAQSPDPDSPRWKGVVALRTFLTSSGDEPLQRFLDNKVAPTLRDQLGAASLRTSLVRLRSGFADAEMAGAMPEGPFAARIEFSGDKPISFELEPTPPHRFVRIGTLGGDGAAPQSSHAPPRERADFATLAELRKKLEAEAAEGRFSGVVLIAKDYKPIFHEAYGYANKPDDVPNKRNTKFNLGSINKMFTMIAVYQLLEAGKLELDYTIGRYLPQFPESVRDRVTVRHLLGHRSGWGAYWDNPTWKAKRHELRSLDDYMAFIKDIPLDFEPGTRKQYSNTGYEVLGAIIEKVTGQSYYDYVRTHIYKPAGMKNTDAYEHDRPTSNLAIGYTGGSYGPDNKGMLGVKGTAAGGGFSTAIDLLRFAQALNDGRLLSANRANHFRGSGVAGGAPGVNAILELNVAGNHTVIVLSNFDPPTAEDIGLQINDMLRRSATGTTGGRKYRIGVGLRPDDSGLAVEFLVPGAPGERGGLKQDDVLIAVKGEPFGSDPLSQLTAVVAKGEPIVFRVRRGTDTVDVTVTPEPID